MHKDDEPIKKSALDVEVDDITYVIEDIDIMINNANKRVRKKLANKRQDNSAFYASQFWVK